jgi:predicted glycoside hydrolase/deacetylase ChbG (UPF0249 family)
MLLCADDYAISEGVSNAMLNLVDARRLTAVSAMASTPAWPELAPELAKRRSHVAIGLHLDLTLRPFAGKQRPFGLSELIIRSLRGQLDVLALAAEFERQFDVFEAALGAAPDHVDGHHHVHALPQIRGALLSVLDRRYGGLSSERRPLIRDPADSIARIVRRRAARGKALAVALVCAGFGARVNAAGFATNVGFSGFSRFRGRKEFERELGEFLKAPGPRHLVMCHPGFADAALARLDPVTACREDEYAALMENDEIARKTLSIRRAEGSTSCAFAAWSRR